MSEAATFKVFRRGGTVIIRWSAPVSAHHAGPGLTREPYKEKEGEMTFRFSYRRTLHQPRRSTGKECLEEGEVKIVRGEKVTRIRIMIDGREDVVIDSSRRT